MLRKYFKRINTHRDTDRNEANEEDAGAPLLPPTRGGNQPDATIAAATSESETRRGEAIPFPDVPNDVTRAAGAPGAEASWRREVIAPAMVAAARVSARLVSASGPVVDNVGSRSSRRGTFSGGLPRRGVLPGDQGAATAAAAREQRSSGSRRSRSGPGGGGAREGEPQGRDRDFEEGNGEENHPLAVQGAAGGASLNEVDEGLSNQDSSSSDSEGDSSSNCKQAVVTCFVVIALSLETFHSGCISLSCRECGSGRLELTHSCTPIVSLCSFVLEAVVVTHPPEEIRRALASSRNTIALLLLLLLHYVATHIMGIACVVLGSAAIKFLDQRLRSHADAQVRAAS